jgi:hypothetical protein
MIELLPFDALALSLHHSPGVHAILVGSGLSRAAGIPTGWEIALDLIRRLAALDGVTEHDDWAKWYRDKYGKEPSYSEILDALASTPAERRAILHGYIDAPEGGDTRKPTKAHYAIAQLVASGAVRVIITTNFDRLIENALREAGIEPTVIASDDAIAGATPLVHAKCTVIKVHGDYLDARIKNTDEELVDYSPAMNALLDQVFDNFGLLAVGWSGEWDTALRSSILRAPSRRYPFYWATRGSVGGLAQDPLDQRGGRSFPIADAETVPPTNETMNAIVETFMVRTEVLRRACLICGRWGTPEANRAVARAILSLSFAAESQAGYNSYISLREFGASVCFYWSLMGLLDRGDWQLTKSLLHSEIKRDTEPFVSALPPLGYDRVDWNFLTGLENRTTPINDYLFAHVKSDVRDISVREARTDELFDKVEVIISLEAAIFRLKWMEGGTGLWFWTPVGRFVWKDHGRLRDEALSLMEGLPDTDPIYTAGLLGGSRAAAAPMFQAVRDFLKEGRY